MLEDRSDVTSAEHADAMSKKAYAPPTFQSLSTHATQVKGPPGPEGATTSTNSAS